MVIGRAFWAADLCACVSGLPEEERVHLQHTHNQEGACAEAGAPPCRPDGGENMCHCMIICNEKMFGLFVFFC